MDSIEAKDPNSNSLQDTDKDKLINPIDSDDDNDTIPTFDELALGTNPLKTDSDGDGIADAIEVGTNFQAALDSDKDGIIDALDTTVNEIKDVNETSEVNNANDNNDVNNSLADTNTQENNKAVRLELTGIENKNSIQSSILYFPYLSVDPVIKKDASDYLDKVASWLKKDSGNKINLIGHTDNIGSKQSNLALGIRRVMVIRELLINRDSPIAQIEIMSRGESQPITSNKTEAERIKNRRVEITPFNKK